MGKSSVAKIGEGAAIVLLGLIIVTMLLWGIDSHIIQPAFFTLERQQAIEDIEHVKFEIVHELSNLSNLASDWASWDDLYRFAEQRNQDFVVSNYPDPAQLSQNSRVDLLVIVDREGVDLLHGNYHPDLQRQLPFPDFFTGKLPLLSALASIFPFEQKREGLLLTNHGILLLVARPILTTEQQGPSRGLLFMGRFLTEATCAALAERVGVRFALLRGDEPRLSPSEQAMFADAAATGASPPEFREGFLYQVQPDIENQPVLMLRSEMRRQISALGRSTGNILLALLWFIAFFLLIGLAVYRSRMKSTAEALRESESRYRMLFENNHTVMVLTDPGSGAIRDANPAACAFYGWSREQLMAMRIDEINILTREEVFAEMVAARSEKRNAFVFKHRKADDSLCDVEVYVGPLIIKGQVLLFSIVHDISARKRAEAARTQLEEKTRQLRKAKSLGRMAGAIAHLFNNHLSVVIGSLELALSDLPGDAPVRRDLSTAMQAAWRASEISRLMLTYLGKETVKPQLIDLSEVCRQYLPVLQHTTPSNVVIQTNFRSPGLLVRADVKQLQQVLANLLTNGWEAIGSAPGRISLTTGIIAANGLPQIHINPPDAIPAAEKFACLEVADSGSGMTEEALDQIFDPFYTTKFTGRGLGIPVILGIIKGWGGCIAVESSLGQGSVFRVYLPLVAENIAEQRDRATKLPDRKAGTTVLLVDDQEMVRTMAQIMLERLDSRVVAAKDGNEALALFRNHGQQIDCVISDVAMSGMTGWDLLVALRRLKPGLPVILTSGYSESQVMKSDHAERPQAFLGKPFTMAELEKTLNKALGG